MYIYMKLEMKLIMKLEKDKCQNVFSRRTSRLP